MRVCQFRHIRERQKFHLFRCVRRCQMWRIRGRRWFHGVGFLAVPVMTGGAAYDLCQILNWKHGLNKRPAHGKVPADKGFAEVQPPDAENRTSACCGRGAWA